MSNAKTRPRYSKSPDESKVILIHESLPEDANAQGNVHGGVVMKLMDAAAGVASRRHCRKNVVTARVDSLEFLSPVYIGDLIIIKAILTYTGRTSMEIKVKVESENMISGKITPTTSAFFTMVALDENGKPTEVPTVLLNSENEKQLYEAAKMRVSERKKRLIRDSK
ncbi:MAG: acyl-CoA thioesterase [Epsilonproteobacteria bacterium]|nr:acyl-CoA thioesterase [Campylobacterota bacterium]